MKRGYAFLLSFLLVVFCFNTSILAQETTGNVEGFVRDEQNNVVSGVSVTIQSKSGTTGFRQNTVTDADGKFIIVRVPPGIYTITTSAASGFGAVTVENVDVSVGRTSNVPVTVKAGGVSATVDITTTDGASIDTTGSQIQTNISAQQIETIPTGVSFDSLLRLDPATRPEGKSGGFQVDGASGAENSFIIDGQDVSNYRTNTLNGVNNIPTFLVQELSVKSSGFDAEFGGATGAVVSVVTKGGGNQFNGIFGMEFETPKLNAGPRRALTRVAAPGTAAGNIAEYVDRFRNDGTDFFPTAQISGPIIKDRLFGLVNYSRQVYETSQTSRYFTNAPLGTRVQNATEDYRSREVYEYAFTRIDANPFDNLRLTGTFLWNPQIVEGVIPDATVNIGGAIPSAPLNGITYRGYALTSQQGGRVNSNNVTTQAIWTPTSRLVFTGRYNRGFLNNKPSSYGVPQITQYVCSNLSGSLGTFTPAQTGCQQGFSNIPNNRLTAKDVSIKTSYEIDGAYVLNGFLGDHQFKSGYQFSRIFTDIDGGPAPGSNITTGTINLYYGLPITSGVGPSAGVSVSPNAIGYGRISRFGQIARGSNRNQAIYIQDKWQPINRLTLNLGVRFEEEFIPTFNGVPIQVKYGWADKISPRIGAAFDIFGDGKTKIFGSYGKFYDRLKFELPTGSFGGDYFRRDFFEIFPGETYNSFTLQNVLGNFVGPSGGQCPVTSAGTRVKCHLDLRVPSFSVSDLKPYTQQEITVGFEREFFTNYLFTARYTNKQVLNAIEDAGAFNEFGSEVYSIVNPCKGEHVEIIRRGGYARCVEAERKYNAVQVEVERRLTNGFYFNTNYTFSRLVGNYGGLASSDENGRLSPGVTRYFDIPAQGFAVLTGQPDNGRLATDRPHVFNAYGSYTYDWFKSRANETTFSLFTTFQSGTPLTTTVEVFANEIIMNGRGDLGRTEMFTRSDVALSHRYRFGRDNRLSLVFNVNVNNVFNENNVTDVYRLITDSGIDINAANLGFEDSDAGLLQAINTAITTGLGSRLTNYLNSSPTLKDPRYGRPNQFQAPRNIRFGFRFQF